MKKAILIIAGVVLVFSGVAAVSAYEAHIINVKTQVEHALKIEGAGFGPDYAIDWDVAFPQEWLTANFTVSYSQSFCDQDRVHAINYSVWAEAKPVTEALWGGDFMYIGLYEDDPTVCGNLADTSATWQRLDSDATAVTSPTDYYATNTLPAAGTCFDTGLKGTLEKEPGTNARLDPTDWLCIAMDVPAFEYFYNDGSDPNPKPSGLDVPTVLIDKELDAVRWIGASTTKNFGANIKIQVTEIRSTAP